MEAKRRPCEAWRSSQYQLRVLALTLLAASCTDPLLTVEEPRQNPQQSTGAIDVDPRSLAELPKVDARLRSSPYAYYRFVAGPFSTAVCDHYGQATLAMPTVSLHGDAHIEQYAVANDGFGIVDFDDATAGPPVVDWLRFASSLWIATNFNADESKFALLRFLEGYRRGLTDPECVLAAPEPKAVSRVRSRFKGNALEWLNAVSSMIQPIHGLDEELMHQARRLYVDAMLRQNPELDEHFFKLKAGGELEMGIGSAHEKKFLVRVEGRTDDPADDVILEKKEMKSHLTGLCSRGTRVEASRVIDAEAKFSRTPQRLLGYVNVLGAHFYIHAWRVHYKELSIADMANPGEMAELAYDFGLQLGRGHPLHPVASAEGRAEREAIQRSLDEVEPDLLTTSRDLAVRVRQGYDRYQASTVTAQRH
jgi:uncharacterized protein (DUF2252 family)